MRSSYDFSAGQRGKYAAAYAKGTNLVLLDPDVARAFPDPAVINRILRAVAEASPTTCAETFERSPEKIHEGIARDSQLS